MNSTIESIISKLELQPHPEGGYFKESYRSLGEIDASSLPHSYAGKRNYSTCIYFLLTSDKFSAFHRIKQDEIWHFYDGSSIVLHTISETGAYAKYTIGKDLNKGERPQLIVPGGNWFAAEVLDQDGYALVGCTVSPGFSFEDFEMKSRQELTALFPEHETIISKMTHF